MKLITANQVARRLGVRVETIYRYVRDGKLPSMRVGGRWKFSLPDIEKALRSGNGKRGSGRKRVLDPNDDPILRVIGIGSDGHLAEDIDHHLYGSARDSVRG